MTDRRVALLRGINVGRAKRIAMADLRRLFQDLGHRDVRTLLNSGNVVFSAAGPATDDVGVAIEDAIAQRLDVRTRVIVLALSELRSAIRANPLVAVASDPSRTLIMPLHDDTAARALGSLLTECWAPEVLALRRGTAYLWCANGIAAGRLWKAVDRAVGDGGTARNLSTMTKLVAMAGAPVT